MNNPVSYNTLVSQGRLAWKTPKQVALQTDISMYSSNTTLHVLGAMVSDEGRLSWRMANKQRN